MGAAPLGLVLALVLAVPALGQAQTVVVPLPVVAQEGTFSSGNQYYDADLSGFRDYLEAIRASDPALYVRLDAELDGIETERTLAHVLMWGVGLGGGLTLLGLAFALHDDCGANEYSSRGLTERELEEQIDCQDSAQTQDLVLLGSSIGVFASGLIAGLLLIPGRPTFLRMVNEHNRLKPSVPLRIGLSATSRYASARLVLSF